jgi:hypothetical protein
MIDGEKKYRQKKRISISVHIDQSLRVVPDAIATDLASPHRAEARSMTSSGIGATH